MRERTVGDGPLEAVLLPEAGARLHRLRAFGQDLLRTPADPADHLRDPLFWGGYVMAPWCNRIAAGATPVNGRAVRLASNFADGSAIHGQVYARPWIETGAGAFSVRAGDDGWPWPYEVTLAAEAHGARLSLAWRLTNLADEPMPAGLGFHPWWQRPIQVCVPGGLTYGSNIGPTAEPQPVSGAFDLRTLGAPASGLDGTWTVASAAQVELAWPEIGLRAAITAAADARYVAVANPDDLDAVAVEPQTHAPDGLQRLLDGRTDGLALLPGGESLAFELEVVVNRA
jgi:aldose 1-epimerase